MSDDAAWLASSTGHWRQLTVQGVRVESHVFGDTLPALADSAVSLHYRGLARTSEALLGTVVGSPGLVRRAPFDRDGELDLPRTTVWRNDDPAVFLDAVLALDDSTIIAVGDPLDGCLTVLRSDDGGRSWSTVPCAAQDGPGVPASREGEAAFAASNGNLSAAGDTVWMLSGGSASRVYRSLDRGQSWTAFETPLQQGGQMTGGFSMDFADADHGIIWGGNWEAKADNVARGAITADGGETWTLVADGTGPGYGSSIRYRPGSSGRQIALVGTPGGIDVSDDGGQSWRHVSDSAFYAARFSPTGEPIASWGGPGTDPGCFNIPHNVCMHPSLDRIVVVDQGNHRAQIFAPDGTWRSTFSLSNGYTVPRVVESEPVESPGQEAGGTR